ncbi:recombinase family protein [Kocuria sp. M4R2S49]|uniref:recombinase family protein n=1 Tax=Kocuria rhizosphaericola TaxID=3376284 RepID=UPI00378B02EA
MWALDKPHPTRRLSSRQHPLLPTSWLGTARGAGLRVLNLGGGDVDTATPMGSMVFTVMAALAQMEMEIKRERITDSVAKRRAAGKDLGGRRQTCTDSQIRNALRLIETGEPATEVAHDLGMSRATLYRRIRELATVTI